MKQLAVWHSLVCFASNASSVMGVPGGVGGYFFVGSSPTVQCIGCVSLERGVRERQSPSPSTHFSVCMHDDSIKCGEN